MHRHTIEVSVTKLWYTHILLWVVSILLAIPIIRVKVHAGSKSQVIYKSMAEIEREDDEDIKKSLNI